MHREIGKSITSDKTVCASYHHQDDVVMFINVINITLKVSKDIINSIKYLNFN